MAVDLEAYGCKESCKTDQWSVDAMRELALQHGIGLSLTTITAADKTKLYESVKVRLDEHLLELPPEPALRSDLLNVKKRVSADGGFKVVLPETNDGRHCDYAAMLALLCGDYLQSSGETRAAEVKPATPEDPDDIDWSLVRDDDDEPIDNRDWA
jgi:hypothetical protein